MNAADETHDWRDTSSQDIGLKRQLECRLWLGLVCHRCRRVERFFFQSLQSFDFGPERTVVVNYGHGQFKVTALAVAVELRRHHYNAPTTLAAATFRPNLARPHPRKA